MSQPLPTGEFRWIDVKEEKNPKDLIEKLVNNSIWKYGYLLEVDVDYPRE